MSDTFKIHLQGTAETRQWLAAEGQLRKLDNAANDFLNSLKQGVGIDLGGKIVNSLAALPNAFQGLLQRGFEFNKVMATSEGGIANVLGKFMKLDAQAAKREAAKAMEAIMEWEPKAAGSLQDLMGGFMATVGAGQAAGLTVAQNVELTGKFANALAALGMDASQLTQEMRAIFTGNITPDAQMAETLEITPQAVKAAKDAGTFYEFLNKQIGSLGNTAAGPAVVLSSLSSAIDKAAGDLSKGLFDELISGAEQLTASLGDPAIKKGLEEAGVSIAALVRTGVQLSVWAVENAPLLLRVADGAFKVGAAIAAIKLTEILAGLLLKAARWGQATIAINSNTVALERNAVAQSAALSAGGTRGVVPPITNAAKVAGTQGGTAMGNSMVTAFTGIARAGLVLGLVAAVSYAVDAAMKYMKAQAFMAKVQGDAEAAQKKRIGSIVTRGTAASLTAVTPAEKTSARTEAGKSGDQIFKEIQEIQRRINQNRAVMAAPSSERSGQDYLDAMNAVVADEAEIRKLMDALIDIGDALKRMDTEAGAVENLRRKTSAAEEATTNFNAALIAAKAAAGDSAAQIQLATDSVDALVKKLEEATKTKLDASTFESLLKSLEAIDKTKVDDATVKNVEKLIDAAGKLRDLKADAAKEAEQQAADAKRVADDAVRAADELRAKEIERLELQGRVLDAAGKTGAADDARARAEALRLQEQLVEAGLEEGDARKQSLAIVQAEIAAEKAKADAKNKPDFAGPRDTRAMLSSADRRGDGRDILGMGQRNGFALDAFAAQQKTPLRDTFQFPALDAFAASQPARQGAASAAPAAEGADVAGAAKQAADAASELAKSGAKNGAATIAEIMRLRSELDLMRAQQEQQASQIAHARS